MSTDSRFEAHALAEKTMPFGNYKGKTLAYIYHIDPDYLVWARDELSPPIQDDIADFLVYKNKEIINYGTKS